MKPRIAILGAGFGGLELSTSLSEALGDASAITLVDKSDAFMFGFSKLDVLFGRQTAAAAWVPYAGFAKPGVRFVRETVTATPVGENPARRSRCCCAKSTIARNGHPVGDEVSRRVARVMQEVPRTVDAKLLADPLAAPLGVVVRSADVPDRLSLARA